MTIYKDFQRSSQCPGNLFLQLTLTGKPVRDVCASQQSACLKLAADSSLPTVLRTQASQLKYVFFFPQAEAGD